MEPVKSRLCGFFLHFIALRLHFLFHFFVISCSVLVAGIVCNALRGGCILQYPGQLIGNFKIGVRIQMTIGSQGCLYFFMPQRSLINRGFSPMLMSREAWECLNAWILMRCVSANSASFSNARGRVCLLVGMPL